ncbi:hypothetical protein GCM10023081_39900 [Arthrobacter ginkgonis]|uniref:Uncharacterized protein n=1 Tax=Arthrobacter ginkgonis TaxID=1630594 RepID=A0ABP7D413_9MICC
MRLSTFQVRSSASLSSVQTKAQQTPCSFRLAHTRIPTGDMGDAVEPVIDQGNVELQLFDDVLGLEFAGFEFDGDIARLLDMEGESVHHYVARPPGRGRGRSIPGCERSIRTALNRQPDRAKWSLGEMEKRSTQGTGSQQDMG